MGIGPSIESIAIGIGLSIGSISNSLYPSVDRPVEKKRKRADDNSVDRLEERLHNRFVIAKKNGRPQEYYTIFRGVETAFFEEDSKKNKESIGTLIEKAAATKSRHLMSNGIVQRSRKWLIPGPEDEWSRRLAGLQFPEKLQKALTPNDFVEANHSYFIRNVEGNPCVLASVEAIVHDGKDNQHQVPHTDMGKSKFWKTFNKGNINSKQSGSLFIAVTNSDLMLRHYVKGQARLQKIELRPGDALYMSSHQVHCGTGMKGIKLFYSYCLYGYKYNARMDQEWFPAYAKEPSNVNKLYDKLN